MDLLAERRAQRARRGFVTFHYVVLVVAFVFPVTLDAFPASAEESSRAREEGTSAPEENGIDNIDVNLSEPHKTPPISEREVAEVGTDELDVDRQEERPPFDYEKLDAEPDKLKKLDKGSPIWCSIDRKRVALGGEICLREGSLEFFACKRNTKEYESIIALDVPPHLIHAALLAIGAKQGAPAKFDPVFVPPSGDEILIEVCWIDVQSGQRRSVRAQEFVLENETKKTMSADWVFTGGLFGVNPDGKKYYLANVTGEIFGVSNFPGSVLDVPFESTSDSSELYYTANTETIPPEGTHVLLILTRKTDVVKSGVVD